MKKYAVIVGGGKGIRMNTSIPKQFILLHGRPVIYYTLNTFLKAYNDLLIILVLPEEFIEKGQKIVDSYFDRSSIQIISGGNTRFHSVQNGLKLIRGDAVIAVHDAVRCLVSETLIRRCYQEAEISGSAIPVVNCKDSVRLITGDRNEAIRREFIKLVQTPQVFHSEILLPAFQTDYEESFTDEATVVEASGFKVNLVEGEEQNIKITLPVDLLYAEQVLAQAEI